MSIPVDPASAAGDGRPARRPLALVLVGIGAVVVVAAAVALVLGPLTDDDGCLDGLRRHLPDDPTVLHGSDLERARSAGYDDGDLDALVDSAIETGIQADPLTTLAVTVRRTENGAGYDPGSVACWVGDLSTFAARGDFDADAVQDGTASEDAQVRGDLLVTGTPEGRDAGLEGAEPPEAADAALTAMADNDAVTFQLTAISDDGEAWAGVGLAPGDDWDLVVVWTFPDDDRAEEGEDAIRAALADDSALPELVEGDPTDDLRRSGSVVALRAPLDDPVTRWLEPLHRFDPVLLVGRDG